MTRNFLDQPDDSWSALGAILTIGDLSLMNNQDLEVFRSSNELRAAQTLIGLYRFASDACFGQDTWLTLRVGSLKLALESINKVPRLKRQFIRHVYGIDCSPINFRHAQDHYGLSSSEGSGAIAQAFLSYREKLADARCTWRSKDSGQLEIGVEAEIVVCGRFCQWGCICGFSANSFLPSESVAMRLLDQFEGEQSNRVWFNGFSGSELIAPVDVLQFLNSLVRSAIAFSYAVRWGDGLDSRSIAGFGEYTIHRGFTIANISAGTKLIEQGHVRLRTFSEPLIFEDPVWRKDNENPFITTAPSLLASEPTSTEIDQLLQKLLSHTDE
jgi:hypothetical protein